ncbi:MAG: DUF1844 domain-containing protein [Planctomycetes bacterium]|jgi:hypothetical protein|nr:DUF1844 domain-containing protein [Planctomycetota bacterium]
MAEPPEEKAGGGDRDAGAPLPAASFLTLVAGLSTQVLMNLGDLANPLNGKREPDLDHAKYTIDLLGVIQEKTKGNLTAEEAEVLELTLYELRMKYVAASGY